MSWLTDKIESLDDPGAPVTSTRVVGTSPTPFQTSTTKHVLVMYTFTLDADNDETATLELRSDADNPPLTVRASAHLAVSDPGAATPKVVARQQLVYVVPPGHYVSLVTSGTGTVAITNQTEMVIS